MEILKMLNSSQSDEIRSTFHVSDQKGGKFLMDNPSVTYTKGQIMELRKHKEEIFKSSISNMRKIFVEVFTDESFIEAMFKNKDRWSFEIASVQCDPMNYIKGFEWNVLGKDVLALANISTSLSSGSKTYNKLITQIRDNMKQKIEEKGGPDKVDPKTLEMLKDDTVKQAGDLIMKMVNTIVEKNKFTLHVYEINIRNNKIEIGSNNKYMGFKRILETFLTMDYDTGYYVTDYMLLRDEKIDEKEYIKRVTNKVGIYEAWIRENLKNPEELPQYLLFHTKFRYSDMINQSVNILGKKDIIFEDDQADMFHLIGEENMYSRLLNNLETSFGL